MNRFYRFAGALLFIAGAMILMGIITAEIYYPAGYSTSTNEISDLGATRPPGSVSHQPSAGIFNATMQTTGFLIMVASYFIKKASRKIIFPVFIALFGLGVFAVGLFPGNVGNIHPFAAMLAFIAGGLSAVFSYSESRAPLNYISVIFGLMAIIGFFTAGFFIPLLGDGGTERWIAYPVVLWLVGFGGYYIGKD